jgi:hypothetical protein
MWLIAAEVGMASCGMEPEVLLAKAALLGLTIAPLNDATRGVYDYWYCAEPIAATFYYAPTKELLAYRWLKVVHPEIFCP